jgi:hypothetical protein
MKKILVITYHQNPSPEVPKILDFLREKNHVDEAFWNEMLYYYDGKNKHILYFDIEASGKMTRLTDYDMVYIRSDGPIDRDSMQLVVREATRQHITIIGFHPNIDGVSLNAKADTTHYCNNELQMQFPQSFFGNYALLIKHFNTISAELGLPLVCKPNNLSKGRGVALVHTVEEFKENCRSIIAQYGKKKMYFIAQKFIPNDGDYRILMIGSKLFGIKRSRLDKKEFRNNFSLGGTVEKVEVPEDIKKLALRIRKKMKLDFAGIDYILSGKKKIFLEVNRTPGLSGVSQAHGQSMFEKTAQHIEKELHKKTG